MPHEIDPILTDAFGRSHNYLRLALTEKCNLRCFYCMPAEGVQLAPRSHLMTADEIEEIVGFFVERGVNKVRFTGGEPLIRKDAAEIFERLSAYPIEMGITTNGVLMDRFLGTFKECGLNAVNISLDSLQRDTFIRITRRDQFDKVQENIRLFLDEGFRVKLNTVVMRGENDHEILDMVRRTQDEALEIKFIEFMPFEGNRWEWDKGIPSAELLSGIRDAFPDKVEKIEDAPNDTASRYRLKGAKGSFGFISTVSEPFCSTCNRLRITADGKLKNCLFSEEESDLLSALRNGEPLGPFVKGNVQQKARMRAGMESFEELADPTRNQRNRSMIRIGG
jgi:molybdenum cofactor biosynthesis protein A